MQPMLTSLRENPLFGPLFSVSRAFSLICLEGKVKAVWCIIRWQSAKYQSGYNRLDGYSVTMPNYSVATSFARPADLSLRNVFFSQLIKATDSNPKWRLKLMASHLLRFDSPAGRMLSVPLGYAYCSKNGKASAGRPAWSCVNEQVFRLDRIYWYCDQIEHGIMREKLFTRKIGISVRDTCFFSKCEYSLGNSRSRSPSSVS